MEEECIKCEKKAKYKCQPVGSYVVKYYCEKHKPAGGICQKIKK